MKTIGDEVMVVSPDAATPDRVGGRLPRPLRAAAAAAGRDPPRRRRLPRRRLLRLPGQPRPPGRQPGAGRRGAGHRPGRRGDRRPRRPRRWSRSARSASRASPSRPRSSSSAPRHERRRRGRLAAQGGGEELLGPGRRRRADRAAGAAGRDALRRPRLGLHARPRGPPPRRRGGHRAPRQLRPARRLRPRTSASAPSSASASGSSSRSSGRGGRRAPATSRPGPATAATPPPRRWPLPRGATILTGHTADDQVETILYRLASSPSRRALLGMRRRDGAPRPAAARHAPGPRPPPTARSAASPGARTATNADPVFARNRIRHGLLPELERVHPAAAANVLRTADAAARRGRGARRRGRRCARRPRPPQHDRARARSPRCTRRCAASSSSGSPTPPPAARSPAPPTAPRRWRALRRDRRRLRSTSAAASAPSSSAACCAPSVRTDRPSAGSGPPALYLDCAPVDDPAIGETLVSRDDLQRRVAELGAEISRDYAGRELVMVGVLKGAVLFLADLMRSIDVPCEVDFMAVSCYGSQTDSSGVVRILKDLDASIAGRHVLIVEDIIDSGLTLQYLMRNLRRARPRLARGLLAADQARSAAGRPLAALHRLRDPQPLRDRLRPRPRSALPQPRLRRGVGRNSGETALVR